MDWILLDNKPFKKIIDQQSEMANQLESLNKKVEELEKQNKNLENFLINNQKLYLKHFNIICDILQENRTLYMRQFQNETEEIESLKPILNDLKTTKTEKDKDTANFAARFNNLVWRASNNNTNKYLTTPPIKNGMINQSKSDSENN